MCGAIANLSRLTSDRHLIVRYPKCRSCSYQHCNVSLKGCNVSLKGCNVSLKGCNVSHQHCNTHKGYYNISHKHYNTPHQHYNISVESISQANKIAPLLGEVADTSAGIFED